MRVKAFSDIRINAEAADVQVTLGEIMFFFGFILWIAQTYIYMSGLEVFFGGLFTKLVRWFCVFLFAAKLFLTEERSSIRFMTLLSLAGMLALISQHVGGGGMTLLQLLVLVLAARNVPFKRICIVSFWTCLVCFIFVILGDWLGPLHVIPLDLWDRGREYLGFQYVSFGAIFLNNIVFSGLYAFTDVDPVRYRGENIRRQQAPIWLLVLFLAAEYWAYKKTDTSLSFVVGILFLVLYVAVILCRFNFFSDTGLKRAGAVLIFPVSALMTYLICKNYNRKSPIWEKIDDFSHNRVRLTNIGIKKYGVHLFGHIVESNTDTEKGAYFYIDSGYMKNLLNYGIIFLILLLFLYSMVAYAAVRRQDLVLCIWMFCAAIYSIFNNFMISPVENASLFAIWYAADILRERQRRKR